jgi:CheY-like chemotaxis protein
VLGTYFDITGRKRIEEHLIQAQRLETVGKLAGGVTHEFNSILTTILGQSELRLGDLPAGSPLVKNAIEINRAAGRVAKLTRQLLAYGRKQILQPETLDLSRVIASMGGMFHHLTGADVETQILPSPSLHAVKADAGQIEQVIMNMAATLLRRLGYTVLAAANGIEALSLKQQCETGHIDLLFTDVVMPHMSGKELADRVRALYPHTRILFTSAYTENAIVHQGVLDKGVALLQKPFTPSALAHKLREVLDPTGVSKTDAAPNSCDGTRITDGVNTP